MKIMRRLGKRHSLSGQTCPDIFELEDGRFGVIGKLVTVAKHTMSSEHDAVIGDGEALVIIPRQVLLDAKGDIPDD